MALEVNVPIALLTTSAEVCQASSIIVLITNSAEPVIKTVDVKPGTHVIAAGNNTWLRAEFEPSLAARAAVVAVECSLFGAKICYIVLGCVADLQACYRLLIFAF